MRQVIRWPYAIVALCMWCSCVGDTVEVEDEYRRGRKTRKDPPPPPPPPPEPVSGDVACYSPAAPAATCTAPDHCCYTGQQDNETGWCTTESCSDGAVTCDGPEDCAGGERCCATRLASGAYSVACQATACAPIPSGEELCHVDDDCISGRWCITTFGTNPALPRTLAICR